MVVRAPVLLQTLGGGPRRLPLRPRCRLLAQVPSDFYRCENSLLPIGGPSGASEHTLHSHQGKQGTREPAGAPGSGKKREAAAWRRVRRRISVFPVTRLIPLFTYALTRCLGATFIHFFLSRNDLRHVHTLTRGRAQMISLSGSCRRGQDHHFQGFIREGVDVDVSPLVKTRLILKKKML